ncbi:MAG: hypothetical protein QXV55_00705 [Acidilobaceae archaeon]
MGEESESLVVLVGNKAIEIDEKIVEILRKYKRTQMTLEELASALGLESWEEAYEFIKKVPAWVMDVEPSLWKTMYKRYLENRKQK